MEKRPRPTRPLRFPSGRPGSWRHGWDATTTTSRADRRQAQRRLKGLYCPNPECADHERPGGVNLRFQCRYGKQPSQLLYRCRTCRHAFSLRKGTPLEGNRIPDEKFITIATSLGEGTGGRRAARVFRVQPKVVYRIAKKLGRHAKRVLEAYLRNVECREVQLDELWSFLRKKEANLSELEALQEEYGDCWVWVAYDPESKVILAFAVGKRTRERCVELLQRLKATLAPGSLPLFTSDELACYEDALIEVFGVAHQPERDGTRGRFPHPIHVATTELHYAVVHKERKDNRVVRVSRRTVLGDPGEVAARLEQSTYSSTVNTSGVERQNGKLRADDPRLARKTLEFGKKKTPFLALLAWAIAYDHFCRPHKGLRERRIDPDPQTGRAWDDRTPMMALGKTDHLWSVEEFLLHAPAPESATTESSGGN